ncbi:MAG: AAC(3) family N-acetyltransferase [Bacillaceae bacterium]|nr:AAC(3) family N-acetyltransferase [Bacillaceae bacterium]
MSQYDIIKNTPSPNTRESLARDLRQLGLIVLVHSSLKSLGWVCGGPVTVIQALMDVVTPDGTIVMPTQSGDYSDPSAWEKPPVPDDWWQTIRDTMPAYEPEITPTLGMGVIVETFRRWPGVIRSAHPALSFAAWGKHAEPIINGHSLDDALGENSPLARLYERDAHVLFLGTDYETNTSFHLAEYRAPGNRKVMAGAPIMEDGKRVWKTYRDILFNTDIFETIGQDMERNIDIRKGKVGQANCRLFRQQPAVDFAVNWITKYRKKKNALPDS